MGQREHGNDASGPRQRGGVAPLLAAVVRAFVHSTEDIERVRTCVRAVVGEDAELVETRARGYHHQPLRVIESEVRDRQGLRHLLESLATEDIRRDYGLTWERRLDTERGVVHFRLAKQPLLDGRLENEAPDGAGDVVKLELRLRAYPAREASFRRLAAELLG
jgi:RNA binding exosome subunit